MEYIYEVYKEKSFSKAAKNLFISQPSLSAAVKKVEVNLGYEIFDRSTKPIGLTEFGLEYIKSVEKILEIEDNFENYLNDLGDLKAGKVSIGGTSLFISHVLPFIISDFSKKYPKVELNIVEDNTVELENSLASGELDIVIDNYQFDPEIYDRQILMKDHIILVVPSSYESNKQLIDYKLEYNEIISKAYLSDEFKSVPLEVFNDDPFILIIYHNKCNINKLIANQLC
ncbi:LysR family transcriptional regulator [Peptoniphilus asaccharolyticus]|uniref:LysR family transcriptional regulator n=1 Tax=Peptoniphilus asaccharolyticus TaxID=1258 RepID=UPI001F358C6B|nr:LysR family transcriptional regulator [Peptoniphilus asaccharolyticus]